MYWRDIDLIAPRQVPVRTRQNNNSRQADTATARNIERERQAVEPVVNKPLVAEAPFVAQEKSTARNNELDWQKMAQRLQADMDNFRKRQERRANEAITSERERLLLLFLPTLDNLARALAHQDEVQPGEAEGKVRQGIELTRRELMRRLAAEGATPIETIGQTFDPAWHEALATIPTGAEPGTVVEQVEAGYKIGEKLLRPAKVVVAA